MAKKPSTQRHDSAGAVGDLNTQGAGETNGKLLRSFKRWHVLVSAGIGVLSATISGTYALTHFLETKPLQEKLTSVTQALTAAESERQTLRNQFDQLQQRYERVLSSNDRPILLFPADNASIIGTAHNFAWDYKAHDGNTSYYVELQQLFPPAKDPRRFNIVRPESKREYISLDGTGPQQYLWRIRPGKIAGDVQLGTGSWSLPSTFWVYPTVTDRIKSTKKLLVATTSTSYDSFVASDSAGQSDGYEVELFVELPWSRIFTSLQRGEADVAMRSISRSAFREREYSNLRFTNGYVENHQIFVQPRQGGEFPGTLENSRVGVKNNSINEKAAKYLAAKYKFVVDTSFVAYSDLYQALRDGKINFALVDNLLVEKYLGKQLFQFGGSLNMELRPFYLKELERDKEEYAILVHESNQDSRLRTYLNEILASPEIRKVNAELQKRFHLK